jgi:hypothetical protein
MVISTRGDNPCFQGNLSVKWDILFTCYHEEYKQCAVHAKGCPKELKNILRKSLKHCKGLLTVGETVCTYLRRTQFIYIYHVEQKHFNTTLISIATSDDEIQVQIRHYSPKDQSFNIEPWIHPWNSNSKAREQDKESFRPDNGPKKWPTRKCMMRLQYLLVAQDTKYL